MATNCRRKGNFPAPYFMSKSLSPEVLKVPSKMWMRDLRLLGLDLPWCGAFKYMQI